MPYRTDRLLFFSSFPATDPVCAVTCPPGSLLVFRDEAYDTHWHGIVVRKGENDREQYRCVALAYIGVREGE